MSQFVFEKMDDTLSPGPTQVAEEALSQVDTQGAMPSAEPQQQQQQPQPRQQAPRPRGGDVDGGGQGELDRTPTPLTNSTHHDSLIINSGVQVGADGSNQRVDPSTTAETTDTRLRVNPLRTQANPLVLPLGTQPTRAQLFQSLRKGGSRIKHMQGDVGAPNITRTIQPDTLFINGAPQVADVRQGGIGDCYFLAVLLGVVNGDPGKISSMMRWNGANFTTTFNRLNRGLGTWVPTPVTNAATLQHRVRDDGATLVALRGSTFRVADNPTQSAWYAAVAGDTLRVFRQDYYETAMWAPFIEKAYADFAQRYGQYGEGLKDTEQGKSGYKIIDGGASNKCYRMFYGDAVTSEGTEDINFSPGDGIVRNNLPALRRLLAFNAQAVNPGPAGGEQHFIQARISDDGAIDRAKTLSDAVINYHYNQVNGGNWGAVKRFFGSSDNRNDEQQRLDTALNALKRRIQTYKSARTDTDKRNAKNSVASLADDIQKPNAYPLLHNTGGAREYRELNENLGIVINLGSDNSPGRRMVYSSHAYNVARITLKNKAGEVLDINAANLASRASEIDPGQSVIHVENPHARNEPDLDGTGPTDGVNDGGFDMSLDSFLRNFDLLRLATVQHEAQPGDFPVPGNMDVGFG